MKEIRINNWLYIVIAWFDVWIGFYYNQQKGRLYIMVPFIGIYLNLKNNE